MPIELKILALGALLLFIHIFIATRFKTAQYGRKWNVSARDQAVDNLYDSLFRALLTYMMENPSNIGASTHLLFIAKNLERIGDHATNAAEMIYYAATGEQMPERPRGADALAPAA